MKKLLLIGTTALLLATGTAHAEWYDNAKPADDHYYDKWTANGHSCQIIKRFRSDDDNMRDAVTEGTMVYIQPSEIPELEKALHNLKLCDAFYKCVAKRDYRRYGTTPDPKGAPKHCYEPRGWKK
jgi:hypothetical protein